MMGTIDLIRDVVVGNLITFPIGLVFAFAPNYSWAGVTILSLLAFSDIVTLLKTKAYRDLLI